MTQGSEFSMNEKLKHSHRKLKKSINNALGLKPIQQRASSTMRRQTSTTRERLAGTFTRNNPYLARTITGNENINESGINFF